MTPPVLLLVLGGHLLLLVIAAGLVFRLGRFVVTPRDRRSWAIGATILIGSALLFAFVGPLPLPVGLGVNFLAVGLFVWGWRTGRFSINAVPIDVRPEMQRRRQWMRAHVGLLLAIVGAYLAANLALVLGVAILIR